MFHGLDACGVMAAGVLVVSATFAPTAAAAVHVQQYVEVPQCQPNTGQLCPQVPTVDFTADSGEQIQVSFTANANHCSDIMVRFSADTPGMGLYPATDWQRVGPGKTVSGGFKVQGNSGGHKVGVSAQGVPGGCNSGHLDAWGGTVHLDTIDGVGPAPHPVPCKWRHQGGVVIDQGNGFQVYFGNWNDLYAGVPIGLHKPGETVQSFRGELLSAGGEGTHLGFTIAWYDKANHHVDNTDYVGDIDPEFGSLRGTAVTIISKPNGEFDREIDRTDWVAHEHWTCN